MLGLRKQRCIVLSFRVDVWLIPLADIDVRIPANIEVVELWLAVGMVADVHDVQKFR